VKKFCYSVNAGDILNSDITGREIVMGKIIDSVKVEATFPNGRVVTGFNRFLPEVSDKPFQVFDEYNSVSSTIINPLLAESIRLHVTYKE